MKMLIAWILVLLLLIGGSVWISVSVWNECRDAGYSFFYCLRLVSK